MGDAPCGRGFNSSRLASGSIDLVRTHLSRTSPTSTAVGLSFRQHGVPDVRPRPHSHLRRCLILRQLLLPVSGDARYLLSPLLLRAETREEYPRRHQAADLAARTSSCAPPHFVTVSRVRPQGRHHCRRHHGHVPLVLGAVFLRQHHRRVL